jgi:hypothetical protein
MIVGSPGNSKGLRPANRFGINLNVIKSFQTGNLFNVISYYTGESNSRVNLPDLYASGYLNLYKPTLEELYPSCIDLVLHWHNNNLAESGLFNSSYKSDLASDSINQFIGNLGYFSYAYIYGQNTLQDSQYNIKPCSNFVSRSGQYENFTGSNIIDGVYDDVFLLWILLKQVSYCCL